MKISGLMYSLMIIRPFQVHRNTAEAASAGEHVPGQYSIDGDFAAIFITDENKDLQVDTRGVEYLQNRKNGKYRENETATDERMHIAFGKRDVQGGRI